VNARVPRGWSCYFFGCSGAALGSDDFVLSLFLVAGFFLVACCL
jgi:hypothetical protein